MEEYKPKFSSVKVGRKIIECPTTEAEWLNPSKLEGKDIIWFMMKHIKLDDFIQPEIINKFFHNPDHFRRLIATIQNSYGHEMLNILDNCRDYITDHDLQELLVPAIIHIHQNGDMNGIHKFFVKKTVDPVLREMRHTIWSFMI